MRQRGQRTERRMGVIKVMEFLSPQAKPIERGRSSSRKSSLFRYEMSGVVVYDSAARIYDDNAHHKLKPKRPIAPQEIRELEGPSHAGSR